MDSIQSFKGRLDKFMDRDDRWTLIEFIYYTETDSCGPVGLLQLPRILIFLDSNVHFCGEQNIAMECSGAIHTKTGPQMPAPRRISARYSSQKYTQNIS